MLSIPVAEAFASLDAAVAAVAGIDWDRLPALERLDALERLETVRRRHTTTSHDIAGSLDRNDDGQIGPGRGRCAGVDPNATPARHPPNGP
jgi:hypothetical protein